MIIFACPFYFSFLGFFKNPKLGDNMLHIAGIAKESIVDGDGYRYTIFVQGCPHHCDGCHNPTTWPFGRGRAVTLEEILDDIGNDTLLQGVTFSGGEPFMQADDLEEVADAAHERGMDVWCYTGYTFEFLYSQPRYRAFLGHIDVLVDGPYEKDKRDLTLLFRGSSNQRIIDVPSSLSEGRVALWNVK